MTTRRSASARPVTRAALLQRRGHDDGRAVLVVVEDRDVEALLQPALDLEAARRADVLEVDAAVRRGDARHGVDDLVDVGGVEADRHAVDAAELLEQQRLALHHGQRGERADVAEAEHRRAVGDDEDRVGLPGVAPRQRRVGGDRRRHPADARACRRARGPALSRTRTVGRTSILPRTVQRERGVVVVRRRCRSSMVSGVRGPGHRDVLREWGAVGECGRARACGGVAQVRVWLPAGITRRARSWHSPARRSARSPRRAGRSHADAGAASSARSTRATTSASGTGPNTRESSLAAALSPSTHQPPASRRTDPLHQQQPGPVRPLERRRRRRRARRRRRRMRRHSSQSPSRSVGAIESPATATRRHGDAAVRRRARSAIDAPPHWCRRSAAGGSVAGQARHRSTPPTRGPHAAPSVRADASPSTPTATCPAASTTPRRPGSRPSR